MKKLFIIILYCLLIVGCTNESQSNVVSILTNESELLFTGYSTVEWIKGKPEIDSNVVLDFQKSYNEADTITYTLTLSEDLKWSDGNKITAKDYIFSVLIEINPLTSHLFNSDWSYSELVGRENYINGQKNYMGDLECLGIQLINDYTFSIIVNANTITSNEEYHYDIKPFPRHIYAPSCDVVQGDTGVKLLNLSSEEFEDKYLNLDQGIITSGPYYFKGYNNKNLKVLKINPFYKGNFEGQKPNIETIIIYEGYALNYIEEVKNGKIDIITNLKNEEINLLQNNKNYKLVPQKSNSRYSIDFNCDEPSGASSSIFVRQAIAYIIDKNNRFYFNNENIFYGIYGYYTLNDWFYRSVVDENGSLIVLDTNGNEQELNQYNFDLSKAEELLIYDGWIWADDKASIRFDRNNPEHIYRYKRFDSGYWKDQVLQLEVNWIEGSFDFNTYKYFEEFKETAKKIGLKINLGSATSWKTDGYSESVLDRNTNEWSIPTYDKNKDDRVGQMTLKTNYTIRYNSNTFYDISSAKLWGFNGGNENYIYDSELINYAKIINESSDNNKKLIAWQQFQYRYNYLVPSISVGFPNDYVVYNNKIVNLNRIYSLFWNQSILYSNTLTK